MAQTVLIVAALLLLISQIWLIFLGYKHGSLVWAVLIAFFSLIAGLIFCVVKKEGWLPWTLNLVAWLTVIAINRNWL